MNNEQRPIPTPPSDFFDGGWCWMAHPSRNEGNAIPVKQQIVDGVRSYIPLDPTGEMDFVWDERDEEWQMIAGPMEGRNSPPVDERAVRNEGFSAGTIAALAVVYAAGAEVTWGEIIRAAGTQEMLRYALTNEGDWEWAGFAKLAKAELGASEVAAARRAVKQAKGAK